MRFDEIRIQNLLSFGPDSPPLKLENLNVFIGPNGSGKSNLLEVIKLLSNAPTSIAGFLQKSGGALDWFWKGNSDNTGALSVSATCMRSRWPVQHTIHFFGQGPYYLIDGEIIRHGPSDSPDGAIYAFDGTDAQLKSNDGTVAEFGLNDVNIRESILSQRKDPLKYPQLARLSLLYERVHAFRKWSIGRHTALRRHQPADLPNEFLNENLDNFGLVLNRIRKDKKSKDLLIEYLRKLYHGIDDYHVDVIANSVQVFLNEGDFTIPATRLSDGTLRYLCLLAILCHPTPPPVICIEEPEIGLHPDIINTIAELLKLAAQKSQLFITTHSDILVDALTDTPASIVVCEKENGSTTMRRLEPDKLTEWLEKYRLGELWTRGEIGGNRW